MDQKNANSRWMYIDGELYHYDDELYHYGRPGMEWGKHLPGTDWWKEKTAKISNLYNQSKRDYLEKTARGSYASGSNRTINRATRTKATINALGKTASYLGRGLVKYGKKLPGHLVNEARNIGRNIREDVKETAEKVKYNWNAFKQDPKEYAKRFYKNKWSQVRSAIENYYKQSAGHSSTVNSGTALDTIVMQQLDGAQRAYLRAQSEGGVFNNINSVIETMEHNIVSGVNQFLKNNGWDDNVDRLLNKLKIKL